MRKIYLLLAALVCLQHLHAQTAPRVSFSFTLQPGSATVIFTNTSLLPPDGVRKAYWKFGDGVVVSTGALEGTEHRYQKAGSYEACLKIYRYVPNTHDSVLVGSECKLITIAGSTAADSCSVELATHSLSATAFGRRFVAKPWHNKQKRAARICWKFGDGKDTCIQYANSFTGDYIVDHSYAQPGKYEVCVSVKYDGGCESYSCNKIAIEQMPPTIGCEASFTEVATSVANLERRFYAGLQAGKRAEKICWKFGDGEDTCINLASPLNPQQLMVSHRYGAPGNYTVCMRVVYAGGCVAERCRVTEIRMPHNAICGGYFTDSLSTDNAVRFAATSVHTPGDRPTGFSWTFGDGTSATGQQVTHRFGQPGKYPVCVVIKTEGGCETKICKPVVVAGNVQPQLVLSPNPVISNLTAVFRSLFNGAVTVRIYNSNGLVVRHLSRNVVIGNNTWTIDASGLLPGVYAVIVQSPNQFATAIFFKQ